jgi:hypothetical protein
MKYDDEYYRDILDGLSAYYESPLIADLLTTINKVPAPGLGNAWNFNQISGKRWLVETLAQHADINIDKILLLGGWYGVLASLLLDHPAFKHTHVSSLDIDPGCEAVARSVNQSGVDQGRFEALTADMLDFDYQAWLATERSTIVNTSCEHIADFEEWFNRIPCGAQLVLQSNDYFSCDEHVNCVDSLEAFERQAPLRELHFSGGLKLKKYTRFMLIGRK